MRDSSDPSYRDLSYSRHMVGASLALADATWTPDSTWHVVDYSHKIGHGEADFSQAVDNLLS